MQTQQGEPMEVQNNSPNPSQLPFVFPYHNLTNPTNIILQPVNQHLIKSSICVWSKSLKLKDYVYNLDNHGTYVEFFKAKKNPNWQISMK